MGAHEGAGAGEAAGSSPGAPESPVSSDTGLAGEGVATAARPVDASGVAGWAGAERGPKGVPDVAARAFHGADSRVMATSTGGEAGGWGFATGGSPDPVAGRVASAGAAGSSFRWRR